MCNFYSRWQCTFKKVLHCPRTSKFLCVACLALAMQGLLKNCRKTLNILAIFLSANFVGTPCSPGGWGHSHLGHIRDVRPEWVTFPGRKPADGCKFLTKNLRMGHNFDIILPGNGWFSSKLNKTYCSLVNFYCK